MDEVFALCGVPAIKAMEEADLSHRVGTGAVARALLRYLRRGIMLPGWLL